MTCPICRKPTDAPYRPFCSRRCADVDLGRWLTGTYIIPGPPVEDAKPSAETEDDTPASDHVHPLFRSNP